MKQTVQQFMDAVADERKELLLQVQALIEELYPHAECLIWYTLLTHRIKTGWVGLGYWKGGASLYTQNPAYIASFKEKYSKVHTNKSSINFKLSQPLPVEDVKQVIRLAMEGLQKA
jgi:uncharacterized protein YdhG (YjbR/CyaY superfamily)